MPNCNRCGCENDNIHSIFCEECIEEIERFDLDNPKVSSYDKRLGAGFALIEANEDPTEYDDLWS